MAGKIFIDMSKQISKRGFDNILNSKEYMNSTRLNRPLTTRTNNNNFKRISSGILSYSNVSGNKIKNKKMNSEKKLKPTSAFLVK